MKLVKLKIVYEEKDGSTSSTHMWVNSNKILYLMGVTGKKDCTFVVTSIYGQETLYVDGYPEIVAEWVNKR